MVFQKLNEHDQENEATNIHHHFVTFSDHAAIQMEIQKTMEE